MCQVNFIVFKFPRDYFIVGIGRQKQRRVRNGWVIPTLLVSSLVLKWLGSLCTGMLPVARPVLRI